MGKKRVLVIGAGAAGFFCAVNTAGGEAGPEVIIVEKTAKVLAKVRISGGGRCNVTHHCTSIPAMIKNYPRGAHFLKKAFYHFFTTDTIRWFQERGVSLKAEKDGRMFPVTDSSLTIINCLLGEVNKLGIQLRLNQEVTGLRFMADQWVATFAGGQEIMADYICIACGGYPRQHKFAWLQSLGHTITPPLPSLFTFNIPDHPITQLMGISVENARVKIKGTRLQEEGPLLITHWGMSGPAILRLSAWGARELAESTGGHTGSGDESKHARPQGADAGSGYHFDISVNWIPEFNENSLRDHFQNLRRELATQKIINRNPFRLPQRLWEFLLVASGVEPELRWSILPARQQNLLIRNLCSQEFSVKGKTTFKEEFVTAGGIKPEEVDPDTMMSKIHKNLFFAGEILDIDGVTGGFNFQHAWTSGWIAAQSIRQDAAADKKLF